MHTLRENLQRDFLSSIVVFMIALPLCMGIALAAGAPPMAGILGGVIGGIVVGSLGGCPLQVSGPANGLIVVMAAFIIDFGLEAMGIVVLLAGLIQVSAGLLGIGRWFRAVTPAIILGMLTGFAVIIFASQLHVMFDHQPQGSVFANLSALPETLSAVFRPTESSQFHLAALIGIGTLAVMFGWPKIARGRLGLIPASLVAVVLSAGIAQTMGMGVLRVDLPDRVWEAVSLPQFGRLPELITGELFAVALVIAFIASAESLLSATALDQMHQGPRTNYNRELAAQGVGNALCGLVGALPGSGVIVRSAANLQAGARTRLSAILHGVWMLVIVMAFPGILRMIPTASLAAVLVFTVSRLVSPRDIAKLWNESRSEALIYAATAIGIVTTSVLTGVLIGLGLSMAKLLYTFASRLQIRIEEVDDGTVEVTMRGVATFTNLPRIAIALEQVPAGRTIRLNCEQLWYVDHACRDLLMTWSRQQTAGGGCVECDWQQLQTDDERRSAGEVPVLVVVGGGSGKQPRNGVTLES